jgi:hypothetical protein
MARFLGKENTPPISQLTKLVNQGYVPNSVTIRSTETSRTTGHRQIKTPKMEVNQGGATTKNCQPSLTELPIRKQISKCTITTNRRNPDTNCQKIGLARFP